MIFEDPSGTRWLRLRVMLTVIGVLISGIGLNMLYDVVITPRLPVFEGTTSRVQVGAETTTVALAEVGEEKKSPVSLDPRGGEQSREVSRPIAFEKIPLVHAAFVVQGDPSSITSLRAHISQLQVVFPDWFSFANPDGKIDVNVDPELMAFLKSRHVTVMPRLSNTDLKGTWYEDGLAEFFHDPDVTDIFLDNLIANLKRFGADGVNLDIETIHVADKAAFVQWLDTVTDALHERGFLVTVDVPMNDDAYDYEAIGAIADDVVLMAYDQHFPSSPPGPIAAQDWFDGGIEDAVKMIRPDKLIVGIGTYGYDWSSKPNHADSVGFNEAISIAENARANIGADGSSINSHFDYYDQGGTKHSVWFLDAISVWNQYHDSQSQHVRGFALWRTGLEDPGVWDFFGTQPNSVPRASSLETIPIQRTVTFHGEGNLLRVIEGPHAGMRVLDIDGPVVQAARYTRLPSGFEVERLGIGSDKQIAITFDDGPDPRWTEPILSILAKFKVPAAFFVVGDQAERFPQIVKEEVAAGHLIGNHTFLHPDLRNTSLERLKLEVNATQRVIEAETGHYARLFRSPYDADSEPRTLMQLLSLLQLTNMGYVTAGVDIDSRDYERPGTQQIIDTVLTGLASRGPHVVLFHDAGGDRQQTVDALSALIPRLQKQGYEFIGLDRLLGTPPTALMPPISDGERWLVMFGSAMKIWLRNRGWDVMVVLFSITTAIAIARIILLGVLVATRKNAASLPVNSSFAPKVRVLVPAHNEEKVISRTLEALLASDYPHLQVTVINDGSNDRTAAIVSQWIDADSRIFLISQPQSGKAAALNRGLREATEDYIITIDADTLVFPNTVRELVSPFSDSMVDAVCGNVLVGNSHNILTAFQNVEYVTSQNYDRRAFDRLNCISVVPGATGAWRRRALLDIGGYSGETLTEDADLTLTLLSHGGRVTYAPMARAVTEAPETASALFRQRFRWSFGTLQCLWKHRKQFGHGTPGWIALPNLVMFQFLFPVLAPLGDALLLRCALLRDLTPIAAGYLMFLVLDLIGSTIAFKLDNRKLGGIWVVLIQRFYYRQFMYVVTFSALWAAARGARHGWNKLQRRGTVIAQTPEPTT